VNDWPKVLLFRKGREQEDRVGENQAFRERSLPYKIVRLFPQENFTEHKCAVTQVKFNSSGTHVASGDVEGYLKIWTPSPVPK
jgi:WD domain, G-beta repeat.